MNVIQSTKELKLMIVNYQNSDDYTDTYFVKKQIRIIENNLRMVDYLKIKPDVKIGFYLIMAILSTQPLITLLEFSFFAKYQNIDNPWQIYAVILATFAANTVIQKFL